MCLLDSINQSMFSLFSCLLQQQLTQKQHLTVEAVGDPVSSLVLLLGELEAASPTRAIIFQLSILGREGLVFGVWE